MLRLNSLFRSAVALVSGLVLIGVGELASAQSAIDPTVVTNSVTANEGTITTIGGAILGLVVLIVAYRWVRRVIR